MTAPDVDRAVTLTDQAYDAMGRGDHAAARLAAIEATDIFLAAQGALSADAAHCLVLRSGAESGLGDDAASLDSAQRALAIVDEPP